MTADTLELDEPRFRQALYGDDADAQAAAGQGTTAGQAASAIAYAGDAAAHEVYERLHAAYPGGYRHALNEDAPGQDAYVGPAFLRTPMRQPYPERVDGLRAEIRNGRDIGPSLVVAHGGVHVLINGTHHAVARVLEGQREIPVRILDLSKGRAVEAGFDPGERRDDHGRWTKDGVSAPDLPGPPPDQELIGNALWNSPNGVADRITPAEADAAARTWYSNAALATNKFMRGQYAGGGPPAGFAADEAAFAGLINRSAAFTEWAEMYHALAGADQVFGPAGSAAGKDITDNGFVSLTAKYDTAQQYGDTMIRAHVPPGTHALKADQGIWAKAGNPSYYTVDGVREYTLPPGSRFHVNADKPAQPGIPRTIDVTVLPPAPGEHGPQPPFFTPAAAASAGDPEALPGWQRFAWAPGDITVSDTPAQAAFNPAEQRDAHGRWADSPVPAAIGTLLDRWLDTEAGGSSSMSRQDLQAIAQAVRHYGGQVPDGLTRGETGHPAGRYANGKRITLSPASFTSNIDTALAYAGRGDNPAVLHLRTAGAEVPGLAVGQRAEQRSGVGAEAEHILAGRFRVQSSRRDAEGFLHVTVTPDKGGVVTAAFDPAEMRDREGKWTSTGGPKVAGLAPAGRYTMRGLPGGHPLRARLDARLTTAQHRRGKPAELTRPALPPYEEAVARTAAAIVREIKTQDTLEEGRGWYPHEHQLAEQRAKAYGVPVQVAAAVEAATSPRVHWDINQRVTNEILDEIPKAGQPAADIIAAHRLGGGVMWKFRDDATAIALGGDIGEHLHGAKVRSYYSNIMWPGQTGQVTVDTWMNQALVSGLGLTGEQAAALAGEHPKEFPEGIGRMLAADATRAAAEQLTAEGDPAAPDQVQAAYWLAAQAAAGAKPAALWATADDEPHYDPVVVAASPAGGPLEDLDDDHWDAELLLDDLAWLASDIPGRIDLGPPGSARPAGGYAAGNPAAWAIAAADPRFAALGMTRAQAEQAAISRQPAHEPA